MNTGKLVFAQVMTHLPLTTFRRCVARYDGEHKIKHFTCLDQYLCMAFAQLTYRESLRDIEACLRSQATKLYLMGFRGTVARNTPTNANSVRDWRIHADAKPDQHCTQALRRRVLWCRSVQHRVCPGCHDHRSVSVGAHCNCLREKTRKPARIAARRSNRHHHSSLQIQLQFWVSS